MLAALPAVRRLPHQWRADPVAARPLARLRIHGPLPAPPLPRRVPSRCDARSASFASHRQILPRLSRCARRRSPQSLGPLAPPAWRVRTPAESLASPRARPAVFQAAASSHISQESPPPPWPSSTPLNCYSPGITATLTRPMRTGRILVRRCYHMPVARPGCQHQTCSILNIKQLPLFSESLVVK